MDVMPKNVLVKVGADVLNRHGVLSWAGSKRADEFKEAFSRTGTATLLDRNGKLRIAGANAPRIEWLIDPVTGLLQNYLLLEAAGTNLIENGDCEADIVGWAPVNSATLLRDNAQAFSGLWSCKVTAGASTSSGPQWTLRSGSRIAAAATIAYTVSAWVYAPAASIGKTLAFNIQWWNSVPAIISSPNSTPFTLVAGWQRLSWTQTSPAGTVTAVPGLLFDVNQSGAIIWMDVPQLEASAFATSAIPTATGAVTRNVEGFTVPFYVSPREMWIYLRFIEMGAAALNDGQHFPFNIGGNAVKQLNFINQGAGGTYRLRWLGTGTAVADAPGAPAVGQVVELLGLMDAVGRVTIRQSLNGGAETVGGPSAAPSVFDTSFANPLLALNGSDGSALTSWGKYSRCLVGIGGGTVVNTIADVRNIL